MAWPIIKQKRDNEPEQLDGEKNRNFSGFIRE